MDGEEVISVDRICRGCLAEKLDMQPLFTVYDGPLLLPVPRLAQLLAASTRLRLREDDGLPRQLCANCTERLCAAHSFQSMCEQSDTRLRLYAARRAGAGCKLEGDESDACGKSDRGSQTAHEKGLRAFNCPECQKKFKTLLGLSHHLKRHMWESSVCCLHCENVYANTDSLARHSEAAHGVPLSSAHQQGTEENEDHCGTCDMTACRLRAHRDLRRSGSITCERCQRRFSKLKHYRRHFGEGRCDASPPLKEEPVPAKEEAAPWESLRIKEEPPELMGLQGFPDLSDDGHSDFPLDELPPVKEEMRSDDSDYIPIKPGKKKAGRRMRSKGVKRENEGSADGREKHACSLCPRVFSSNAHLEVHMAKHAGRSVPFTCGVCKKGFSRSSHLKRHQLIHSEERLQCPSCDKSFSRKDHLERHQWRHTGVKLHRCAACPKEFVKAEDLARHGKLKHGETPPQRSPKVAFCSMCDRGFTTHKYLELHMRSHGADRSYPCKACDKKLESKEAWRAHTAWHRAQERPFLCSECGQGFTRAAYLTVHMRRHRGEKPFCCGFCGKGFPRPSDLAVHERYHTEDKPHACAVCGKAFHRQYNLKVHLRVHTGERPYACPYCARAFTQPNDLKAHVRRHTGERFACPVCGAAFLHGYLLSQHQRAAHGIDAASHIRRLEKHPPPPGAPPPKPREPPRRGRARTAHLELAAHMASILARTKAQQQQPEGVPPSLTSALPSVPVPPHPLQPHVLPGSAAPLPS